MYIFLRTYFEVYLFLDFESIEEKNGEFDSMGLLFFDINFTDPTTEEL